MSFPENTKLWELGTIEWIQYKDGEVLDIFKPGDIYEEFNDIYVAVRRNGKIVFTFNQKEIQTMTFFKTGQS